MEEKEDTTRCVACSTVQKKGAVTIMKGTGDHTWIETIHLEHEDFVKYMEAEKKIKHASELDTPIESDLPFGFSETKVDSSAEK
jgi:hypothetical protein